MIKTRPNGRVFCGFLKITVDANNQMRTMRPTSTGNAEKQLPNIARKPYVKRFAAKCFENKIFKKSVDAGNQKRIIRIPLRQVLKER